MVIIWKKTDEHGGSQEYLATGRTKLSVNPRLRMENVNDQGSTLAIDFVTQEDVGQYVCEISSNPPATLRHQVSLIGILRLTIYKIDFNEYTAIKKIFTHFLISNIFMVSYFPI